MITRNLLTDYADDVRDGIDFLVDDQEPSTGDAAFTPGFALPEDGPDYRDYAAAATAGWASLGEYEGRPIHLLDLAQNPGTHTTKTFPSLLIVARAVEYTRRTGEPVRIFSPTSGNKGTALRDAVGRAYASGLADPTTLSMTTLAPLSSRYKMRAGILNENPTWSAANPLVLLDTDRAESVKQVGRAWVDAQGGRDADGARLWFSLDLRNYLVADVARAAFEADVAPPSAGERRTHVHAVSSAFGLLGYHAGVDMFEKQGRADRDAHAASLLVQHLGTPDMVLHLNTGSFSRDGLPTYVPGPDGRWTQDSDPHFPLTTDDPQELLDPTFYTHAPVTSPRMDEYIREHGGGGVVVSRAECLARYDECRSLLAEHPRPLPDNPEDLLEWSVVMALTGALNAVDRGLVDAVGPLVVHGSGWYSRSDLTPVADDELTVVEDLPGLTVALG